ncbi:hypothetical protein GBF38_004735, partial [Nibea albiflora]
MALRSGGGANQIRSNCLAGRWLRETADNARRHLLRSHTHFLPVEEAAVPACPLIPSPCRRAGGLWTHGTCRTPPRYRCSCNGRTRKWDWSITTLIMPETTAPTWPSRIAVDLPYCQSFSLGMRARSEALTVIKRISVWLNVACIDFGFDEAVTKLEDGRRRLTAAGVFTGQEQHIRYEHIYLPEPSSQSEVEYADIKRPRLDMGPES